MAAVLNDEDLAAFVDPDAFGEEIILPGGGRVFGVFDEAPVDEAKGLTVGVQSEVPTLILTPADAHDLRDGDRLMLVASGREFRVDRRHNDAAGLAVLDLIEL